MYIYVCEGDEEEEEEEGSKAGEGAERPRVPSLGDYIMHCLTLFWKVLFAFVPPTGQPTSSRVFNVLVHKVQCMYICLLPASSVPLRFTPTCDIYIPIQHNPGSALVHNHNSFALTVC